MSIQEQKRKAIIEVSHSYFNLLSSIDLDDKLLVYGLREGLNKFLSNAMIYILGRRKYLQADYYSILAYEKVQRNDFTDLVYEHMVPKRIYFQKECEDRARTNNLTEEYIITMLNKYWHIAVITKPEEKKLSRKKMPENWDELDIHARYKSAGLELVENRL